MKLVIAGVMLVVGGSVVVSMLVLGGVTGLVGEVAERPC